MSEPGFDLVAASLRADHADLPAFVAVLATRLEGALPGAADVKRRRRGRVERIEVRLGKRRFLLRRHRQGFTTEVESTVHDMRRTTTELPLHEWLAALEAELREEASSSAEARAALERLLH